MKTTIKRSNKGKSIEYWEVQIRDEKGRSVEMKTSTGFWYKIEYYDLPEDTPINEYPIYKNYMNSYGEKRYMVYNETMGQLETTIGSLLDEEQFKKKFKIEDW